MISFFSFVEDSAVAYLVRDTLWGFPIVLSLHALAMGFLAGLNLALALRMLGIAGQLPLALLFRFRPLLHFCAWLSLASGLLLLAAYPAKALTNAVFYLKIMLVIAGLLLFRRIGDQIEQSKTPGEPALPAWQAPCLLLLWSGAITAGRLLAYTYQVLTASELI